jgi:hypothetical protein
MSSPAPVVPTIDSSHVDVTVPLRPEYGSILRLVAASLGADAGFTVDDIDDLRLALSEVFSSLVDTVSVEGRDSDPRVIVTFETAGPGLAVTLSASMPVEDESSPDRHDGFRLDELATSIIRVAVDEFEFSGGTARLVKFGAEQTGDQTDP